MNDVFVCNYAPPGDTIPPVITCPNDVTVSTDAGVCYATGVDLGSPTVSDNSDLNPIVTNDAPAQFPKGTTTVTWTATDDCDNTASCTQTITIVDTTPPTVTINAPLPGAEIWYCDTIDVEYTVSDICDSSPTVEVTPSDPIPAPLTLGDLTITVSATDASGNTGSDSVTVTVNNVAPTVGAITAPIDQVLVDTEIEARASFTDPGTADTHTAEWDWGDGTSLGTVTEADGTVTGSHSYTTPGVYTIKLTVTDGGGESGEQLYHYVVVYDPEGGFVTGGGWINSPAGAYAPDSLLAGKANFGFVSKYKKGATVPTGQTEFRFKAGDLNFHSSSYEWLVIAGHKAMYKGDGKINGAGNYGFMLSAIDADLTPSTHVDLFRIKIWDKGTEGVVYDNQMDAVDDADPTTAIGGGSIKIHKSK